MWIHNSMSAHLQLAPLIFKKYFPTYSILSPFAYVCGDIPFKANPAYSRYIGSCSVPENKTSPQILLQWG